MVLSSLSNCGRYFSINPYFKAAFEFALNGSAAALECGKYTLVEDKLYVTVSDSELRPISNAPLEAHNEFIDIQIVVSGNEGYGIHDRSLCCMPQSGYDQERDIEFFDDNYKAIINLGENDFVIFFPEDAHAPLIGEGRVRKWIFKVKI